MKYFWNSNSSIKMQVNFIFMFDSVTFLKCIFVINNVWVKKTETNHSSDTLLQFVSVFLTQTLKYGSEEKGSSLCRCSSLLGFIMSKKQERLRSELLSEDKITNLLGFLT